MMSRRGGRNWQMKALSTIASRHRSFISRVTTGGLSYSDNQQQASRIGGLIEIPAHGNYLVQVDCI
jgi:hypothetical protein